MQASSRHPLRAAASKVAALLCLLLAALTCCFAAQLAVPRDAFAYEEWAKIYLCDEDGDLGDELASGSSVKAEDLERGLWLEVYYDGDDGDPLENVANPGWNYSLLMGTDMDYDNTKANGEPTCSSLLGGLSDTVTVESSIEGGYKEPLTGVKHMRYLYSVSKLSLDPGAAIEVCAVRSSSASASPKAEILTTLTLTLSESKDDDSGDDGSKDDDSGDDSGKGTSGSGDSGSGGSGSGGSSSGSGKSSGTAGNNIGEYTGSPTANAGRIRWTDFETIDDQSPDKSGESDADDKLPAAVEEVPDSAANGERLSDLGRVYRIYNNEITFGDSSGQAQDSQTAADAQVEVSSLLLRTILPLGLVFALMIFYGTWRFLRAHSLTAPSRLRFSTPKGKHSVVR